MPSRGCKPLPSGKYPHLSQSPRDLSPASTVVATPLPGIPNVGCLSRNTVEVCPFLSIIGVAYSQRKPRLRVSFEVTLKSSWPNTLKAFQRWNTTSPLHEPSVKQTHS